VYYEFNLDNSTLNFILYIFFIFCIVLIAYLIGSINGSLVLGRLKNVDVRKAGSGNAGGTNAFRTQGFKFALGVILIDIGKALLIVYLASKFLPRYFYSADIIICLCSFAVVFGHCYPIWHGFKGGKGIATYAGVVLALIPEHFPLILLIIVSILILTGYVSLSSMLTALIVPILYAFKHEGFLQIPLFWCLLVLSIFVIFTHRSNIKKLLAGTENRFEKVRILHRFF